MHTNIRSIRMERGAMKNIAQELGRFSVFTMDIPWEVTKNLLGKDPEKVQMVTSVDEEVLDRQIQDMPSCDTIVGIGGGQAIDAAKYMSWKKDIRLVSIPTILSVDAFVTTAAGVRRDHSVVYVGESFPDPLIIDFDVIRTAPAKLNIAGIGDLLSAHTATFDWELAETRGRSEYPFSKNNVRLARDVVASLEALLPEIRSNEDAGLRAIVEGYMKLNEVCMPAGHWRIEEGSEHYLFYELEERLRRPFIHGNIIGLGIYIMSRLQNNDPQRITNMMDEAGLAYQPADLDIKRADLESSLLNLKNYVEQNDHLWYTIINEADIDKTWVAEVLNDLSF